MHLHRRPARFLRLAVLGLWLAAAGCATHRPPVPVAPGDGAFEAPVPDFLVKLPRSPGSVRFAVLGDSGTGRRPQYRLARQMTRWHRVFPFTMTLMLGDNLYGGEGPRDYRVKFEQPYRDLLDAGVVFHAVLGNHDELGQLRYPGFHMEGRRYYRFAGGPDVDFFALDSTRVDTEQLHWLETALAESRAIWKIAFFHHPIYSSGKRHGSDRKLRASLEPLFSEYGVDVVFSGHDHLYERLVPRLGIHYFVSGGGGKLRRDGLRRDALFAAGHDRDRHFMLVEIAGDRLWFQAIGEQGQTVDSGSFPRREAGAVGTAPAP